MTRSSSRRRLASALATVAVGFVFAPATGCGGGGEIDYSKAGATGDMPDVQSRERGGECTIESRIPDPPACDVTYEISVRVRQRVAACENFDFRPLYDRARTLADHRIDEVACRAGCRPRHRWLIGRTWDCVTPQPGETFAVVILNFGVLCPRDMHDLPAGVPHPPPGPILGSQPAVGPVLGRHEQLTEEVGGLVDVACNQPDLFELNYYDQASECDTLRSFKPAVEAAVKRARFMYDQIQCQPGCTKAPFRVERTEWFCDEQDDRAKVRVYFVVRCRTP
jgi:hypothetical protein